MLYGLKGTHPVDGEFYQEFTEKERATCMAIANIWYAKGWQPCLIERYWHSCRNSALNDHIGQRKAA